MSELIPTSKIDPSPTHHRSIWGDLAELASSIEQVGLIQALTVRPSPKTKGRYELIAGHRRHRACERAGIKTVPCLILDVDDATAVEMQARENLEREDIHPYDQAAYYGELVKQGFDPGDIAKRFKRKRRAIERALRLLNLSKPARDAFVRHKFDEEAAISISTVDAGGQRDIVAAVEAGGLQPEEIVAYVQRTFMQPLEGVAWRLDDGELVAAAGPCTKCPKRSSVQRDLFEDAAQAATDHCLDVACFQSKNVAVFDRLAATVGDETGIEIYAGDPRPLFMPGGTVPAVIRSSGMVDTEATCPHVSGRTWAEAAEGLEPKPTMYLARDPTGRPRLMFREAVVARLVRKSDAAVADAAARAAADPVRGEVASDAKAEAKLRRELVDKLAAAVAASDNADAWCWVVDRLIEMSSGRAVGQTAKQFEAADTGALRAIVRDGSNRRARAVALALLVREYADISGPIPEAVIDGCTACGVDAAAIEAELRRP